MPGFFDQPASDDLEEVMPDRMLAAARRIQGQLGKFGLGDVWNIAPQIMDFLREEAGQGHFREMTALALAGHRKFANSELGGDFTSFLETVAEIRGLAFDELIHSDVKTDPGFDPSVEAIARRFQRKFPTLLASTPEILEAIQDTLTAEFSYSIYADLLQDLIRIQGRPLQRPGPEANEAASFATDIRARWEILAAYRAGSKRAEVWKALFEWDAARQAAGPDAHIRADFIIHGNYPYQWVEQLDPNRPLDPTRPWQRPRDSSAFPRTLPLSERPKPVPLPPRRPWDPALDGERPF